MPHPHPACLPMDDLLQECEFQRGRAGGPGGQHRNKVETAVFVRHIPTEVTAFATERRSQAENQRKAIRRLRLSLAVQIRCLNSSDVVPSSLWESRCRQQKISCNEHHQDFPSMIAEAMDAAFAKDGDVRRAAAALGCSSSQLIRFIARIPEALSSLNQLRGEQGMKPLRK